jgi:hypothetical protein
VDKITAIRRSLTAFVCGLIGFLPVIGLIPALVALFLWFRVRERFQGAWNPGARYLNWGAVLALLGILGTILVGTVAVMTFVLNAFDG